MMRGQGAEQRGLGLPRSAHRWLPDYLRSRLRGRSGGRPELLVCIADHFEPRGCTVASDGSVGGGADPAAAREFTTDWCARYVDRFSTLRDVDDRPPRHTFFYPWEEYEAGILDTLAAFQDAGYGETELHLHHRRDTPATLRAKLTAARDCLRERHGLLGRTAAGATAYAFVHGNWALCNSRPDGDWCGVSGEIAVLAATGCYADLTFPSAPSVTQPRIVNRLVYAADPLPGGVGVRPGPAPDAASPDGRVLLVSGPLGLNWRRRKAGLLPRLENAELSGVNPPDAVRLALWVQLAARVPGRPDWRVVKLHTHGAVPANRDMLTGETMVAFHRVLAEGTAAGRWRHHYVTARELVNIIRAGAAGATGDPGALRDYAILTNRSTKVAVSHT